MSLRNKDGYMIVIALSLIEARSKIFLALTRRKASSVSGEFALTVILALEVTILLVASSCHLQTEIICPLKNRCHSVVISCCHKRKMKGENLCLSVAAVHYVS